ncbi:MAG: type II toxin-antitoxin system YafQ family toxin, partial [Oscillospiraceae bacterium]|nr:type II toxin-antitoxin system YafQ family toxin [Oscillospiraceae bacterium]
MDKISLTTRFRADYRKVKGRRVESSQLREAAELLAAGVHLPARYQDAPMLDRHGTEVARSCRVGGCMLVYRRKGDRLWLVRIYPLKDRNKITAPTLWLKTLLR